MPGYFYGYDYETLYGAQAPAPEDLSAVTNGDFRSTPVRKIRSIPKGKPMAGRRERALLWLVEPVLKSKGATRIIEELDKSGSPLMDMTYGELMDRCLADGSLHDLLGSIELRINLDGIDPSRHMVTEMSSIHQGITTAKDPELHYGLQDLGWLIGYELAQACQAFDDSDLWYPGVDEGIEPVPDSQVELVIAATQRELDREHRGRTPVSLAGLPPRVQRAFAERRRLLYKTYGIGKTQWQRNRWSLWDVQDDQSWTPPWTR